MEPGLIFSTEVEKVFFNNEEVDSIWLGNIKVWPIITDIVFDKISISGNPAASSYSFEYEN